MNLYHRNNLLSNSRRPRQHLDMHNFNYEPNLQHTKDFWEKVENQCKETETYRVITNNFSLDSTIEALNVTPAINENPILHDPLFFWDRSLEKARLHPTRQVIGAKYDQIPLPDNLQFHIALELSSPKKELVVNLPTGYGKSLIYIYAALLQHFASNEASVRKRFYNVFFLQRITNTFLFSCDMYVN